MKQYLLFTGFALFFFTTGALFSSADQLQEPGYILEHEKDLAIAEPAPHNGDGITTAYKFFSKAMNSRLEFRKRVLYPGGSIGYHLQKEEEIYYIESGTGEMQMNGKTFPVVAGDAILTHPGNSHGLKQSGKEELVVMIVFEKKK